MAGHDSKTFTEATLGRRTIYQLTNKSAIADDRIKQILTSAIKHVPSSFNSQSTRLVVLLRDEHVKFWNIVSDELKAIVPEDGWEKTAGRIAMFRSAFGSILFYEDPEAIRKLQAAQPAYHDKFPTWSEHTSAMHQYYLWTALEAEGFGANLQHYNPLPDKRAAETWNIPSEWALTSQLVFGVPAEGAAPAEKAFEPIDGKRLFIHG